MTKHNGKYYFQYGAREQNSVVMQMEWLLEINPLGNNFTPQSDPLSYKPGGFARGAGHGCNFPG